MAILRSAFLALFVCAVAHAGEERPLLKDFIGINGHTVQFRPKLYAPVCSLVRDYHPVEWDLAAETQTLPQFPFAKNRVSWASVYGSWRESGFRTDACLMFETIKHDKWHDLPADATAYAREFARQFGPSSAKPLVDSVEIGNEPGSYNDEQYTQVLDAMTRGLREGDRRLLIATCALTTGPSGKYAKSVQCIQNSLKDIDILTVHTYAMLEPWPTWKRSYPEDARLSYLKDVRSLADWRDKNAPGKPIWITEFGYDAATGKPDPKTEFAKWEGVSDTQQARYLVRSLLVFSAMPVQRAYIYFFNDEDKASLHAASGITRNFKPKPSFHALAHLQATLGDYRFARKLSESEALYSYEYTHATDANRRIVVLWSPTGSARTAEAPADFPGWRITRAERMPLVEGQVPALKLPLDRLPIDESPLYVQLQRQD